MSNKQQGMEPYVAFDRPKPRKLRLDETPQEDWRLNIPLSDPDSHPAIATTNVALQSSVDASSPLAALASQSIVPDLPLLLDGSKKGYPYISTTTNYHKSLPGEAYSVNRSEVLNYHRESPMSKTVRTVAPYNPFNRIEGVELKPPESTEEETE